MKPVEVHMPEIPALERMRQAYEIRVNHKGYMASMRPASLQIENVSKQQKDAQVRESRNTNQQCQK